MAGLRRRKLAALMAVAIPMLGVPIVGASAAQAANGDTCFGKAATIFDFEFDPVDNVFIWVGTEGNDVIIGFNGDDQVDGLGGNDRICTHEGDDDVVGDLGNDKIDGGPGNDILTGDIGLESGDIDEKAGNDVIYGGSGNDLLTGDHDTDDGSVFAKGGNDKLIDSSSSLFTVPRPTFPFRTRNPAVLEGDVLVGDHAAGELGNVVGKGGNDTLIDKAGDGDLLIGDHFVNEGGNIFGDGGKDKLLDKGGIEDDLVGDSLSRFGDVDADPSTPVIEPAPGGNLGGRVEGDGGDDRLQKTRGLAQTLTGDHFVDHSVVGEGGDDKLYGPDLGTRFVIGDHYSNGGATPLLPSAPVDADSLDGGEDKIRLGPGDDGIGTTIPATGVQELPARNVVAGDNFVRAIGGVAVGGDEDDIDTGAGNEVRILAGPGDDEVDAGPGDDNLFGEDGDDELDGGDGTDFCDGGPGIDSFEACETIVGNP